MKLFLILYLIIAYTYANAQEIISREKMTVNANIIHKVMEIQGDYYVACTTYDGIKIMKYNDDFDNPELFKEYSDVKNYYNSTHNYFYTNGETISAVLLKFISNSIITIKYPNLVKIDMNGNEYMNKMINEKKEYQIFSNRIPVLLNFIDDNNFMIASSMVDKVAASQRMSIYRDNGNIVNDFYFENVKSDSAKIFKLNNSQMKNNNYHINGFLNNYENDSTLLFFWTFNEDGEKLDEKVVSFGNEVPLIHFEETEDYLYLVGRNTLDTNENGERNVAYGFTVSDTDGNIIKRNEYSFSIYNNIPAFNEQRYIHTSDGGFLFAVSSGHYKENKPDIIYRSSYDSYVVKTDSMGNYEWHTVIETEDREEHINYMYEDNDGNYIIFNRVRPTEPDTEQGLPRYMEIVKISSPYSSVNDYESNSFFLIHPNPAGDYIEISLGNKGLQPFANSEEIAIYDVLGERVAHSSTSSTLTPTLSQREMEHRIDISHLPSGVYFVRIGERVEKFVKR